MRLCSVICSSRASTSRPRSSSACSSRRPTGRPRWKRPWRRFARSSRVRTSLVAVSSDTSLFARIAAEASDESPLWAECLRPVDDREPVAVFSLLVDDESLALGLETIYEGYLVHYGQPRLFTPPDPDAALLLGDYLYAHGLVHVAATGNVGAVHDLA